MTPVARFSIVGVAITLLGFSIWLLTSGVLGEDSTTPVGQAATESSTRISMPKEDGSEADRAEVAETTRQTVQSIQRAVMVRVVDQESGKSMAGVPLRLAVKDAEPDEFNDAITENDGSFRFDDLRSARYVLETRPAEDVEFACQPVDINLTEDATREIELPVEKRWFLAGLVLKAGSSRPVTDLQLWARCEGKKGVSLGSTDGDGHFRSEKGCAAGRWTIGQSSRSMQGLHRLLGTQVDLAEVGVGTNDVTHLRIEYPWTGVLRGRVLDSAGRPIDGANIRILGADVMWLRMPQTRFWCLYDHMSQSGVFCHTDQFGQFTIDHLPNDRSLQVVASKRGFVTTRAGPFDPPFAETHPALEIRLPPAGSIVGRVLDSSGKPLAEAITFAISEGLDYQPDPCRTDESGGFALDGLAPGEFLVTAEVKESRGRSRIVASRTVLVKAGKVTETVLQEGSEGARIVGRVVDEDGRPVAGDKESLRVRYDTLRPTPGVTSYGEEVTVSEDGRFEINGMVPGPYRLWLLSYSAGDPFDPVEVEAPAEDVVLTWSAPPRIVLILTVLDARSGQPIPSGRVGLGSLSTGFFDGRSLIAVRRGAYDIDVFSKGYAPAIQELDLRGSDADEHKLVMRLQKGRTVAGIVLDEDGQPVRGIAVGVMLGHRWFADSFVYTGADGRFETDSAPQMGGKLCVIAPGYRKLAEADITGGEVVLVVPGDSDGK